MKSWRESFLEKVSKVPNKQGCLLWTAALSGDGYGTFWNQGAHRVAWEIAFGQITSGQLHVIHACDEPKCCNPKHLMLGTNTANLLDRDRKLRHAHGVRNGRAKLSEEDIIAIRVAKAAGVSGPILAAKYGVDRSQINRIARGVLWSRV